MDKVYIIKIGGNIIDDEKKLDDFLKGFASIEEKKILVHGGGKLATRMAEQLNIPQQMVEGRRITDAETLKIVTMVYAGQINKNIVAGLQSHGEKAIGLTGADGNLILAHKRVNAQRDYGFAGDVDEINQELLQSLLSLNLTPIVAPITHDKKGQLLNTNADTIATELAKAIAKDFEAVLIFGFEKEGVLEDVNDAGSVISTITLASYQQLKAEGKIFEGMIPKLDNAFSAIDNGVRKVIIGNALELKSLIEGKKGTTLAGE